jgi:SNF2 family DNA or RNA helicase
MRGSSGVQLDVRGHDRGNSDARASFLLPCEPCDLLPQSTAPRIVRRRTWVRRLRAALGDAVPTPHALRTKPGPALSILAFQLEPALAVTLGLASRLLIADEVGLGKTIQAGLVVNEVLLRRPDGHILIATGGRRVRTRGPSIR